MKNKTSSTYPIWNRSFR